MEDKATSRRSFHRYNNRHRIILFGHAPRPPSLLLTSGNGSFGNGIRIV